MQHEVEKKKENFLKIEGAEVMKGVILKTDDGIKLFDVYSVVTDLGTMHGV